jgi:hypothetical protein
MEAVAMETIGRDFPNHWLLVEVTETKDGVPVKGVVIKAAGRREEVVKEIGSNKGKKLYFFFSGIAASPDTAFALQCPSK